VHQLVNTKTLIFAQNIQTYIAGILTTSAKPRWTTLALPRKGGVANDLRDCLCLNLGMSPVNKGS